MSMNTPIAGPWEKERVHDFLASSVIPVRLASINRAGYPVMVSLWYLYEDGQIWCAVQKGSWVAKHLARDHKVGFEIAPDQPPYHGVRGRGHAHLVPEQGEAVLRRLIRRYLGDESSSLAQWLMERVKDEVAVKIEPTRISTWDYKRRMRDIQHTPIPVERNHAAT